MGDHNVRNHELSIAELPLSYPVAYICVDYENGSHDSSLEE